MSVASNQASDKDAFGPKQALQDKNFGVKINGELINNIRYVDDTAMLCDSIHHLRELLDCVNTTGRNCQYDKGYDIQSPSPR